MDEQAFGGRRVEDLDAELSALLADGYAAEQKFDICRTARSNRGVPVAFLTGTGGKRALVFPGEDGYRVEYTDVVMGEPGPAATIYRTTWVIV